MPFDLVVRFIRLLFVLKCASSIPLQLVTENATSTDELPYETQHAVCKVFTKEVEATAKATITRQLKGVCSTKELNVRFEELYRELQEIKQALNINGHHYQVKSLDLASAIHTSESILTTTPLNEYSDFAEPENVTKFVGEKSNYTVISIQPQYDTLNDEISALNDTIVESKEGDLYFYYWKIPEIKRVLKKRNIYVSTPSFSILGHMLRLQFYPNYRDEYIGILLKPQSNSFLKKHKIIYVGQKSTQNQISSKILYGIKNEDKVFKIERETLTNDFLSNGSLLVKVKIYLNS